MELQNIEEIKHFFGNFRRQHADVYAELVPPIKLQVNSNNKRKAITVFFQYKTFHQKTQETANNEDNSPLRIPLHGAPSYQLILANT